MKNALFTITLVIILAVMGAGQSLVTKSPAPNGKGKDLFSVMIAPGVSMLGIQNNAGTYDSFNNRCWGNIFVLSGSGEWFTNHLTITMDYVDGLPNPDKGNIIAFGTWTMVVYKDNNYFGTVYGEITEGNIAWWVNPKTGLIEKRNTDATLRVLGTLDGMEKLWDEPPTFKLNADTRFDGNRAVTTATLDADY